MKPDLKKNRETDSYMDLVRELSLRPIRNEAEYDRATVVLHRLAVLGEKKLNAGQSDYLDALSVFIEKYDDEHYQIDTVPADPCFPACRSCQTSWSLPPCVQPR